ncbi:MAG: FtsX-like permease family protein [Actinomycetota bacterium]
MTFSSYVVRDLVRNPRRTLASMIGVIVGVGLFSSVLFFIDGSGASMTARAVAPLTVDMQRVLTTPLGGSLRFGQAIADPSLAASGRTEVTLTVTNSALTPSHEVVVREKLLSPLTYVTGSTALDGETVPDVGGEFPLSQGPAGIGLNIGTVAVGSTRKITFQAEAGADIPITADLPVGSTISTREAPTPVRASEPVSATLVTLADRIHNIPGVAAADPLVFVDMARGAIATQTTRVPDHVRLFAFDASYQAHYAGINVLRGGFRPSEALISAEMARALHVDVGDTINLNLPLRATPVPVRVSGISDLSTANSLFESRQASSLEHFQYIPYSIVVDHAFYRDTVAPVFEAAIAKRGTRLVYVPLQELDISIDRGILNADPATALAQTHAIATQIEAVASDQDYVVDNISNALQVAAGDAIVAKKMFLYLGLPGMVVAAILTAYAGSLLAGSQRRENALLRVRGADRRDLLTLLSLRTIALAGVGSVIGVALGFVVAVALLGRAIVFEASPGALGRSAFIAVFAGVLVTATALYVPGRRLITREIKQELAEIEEVPVPAWRRFHLDVVVLSAAVAAQWLALRHGAFDIPPGSVYAGQSVSLPLILLGPPIVAWLAGTVLIARLVSAVVARGVARRTTDRFEHLVPGVLWRSIARRLRATTSGVTTVALVVGLGTMLLCFSTAYGDAKTNDARFLVGSDIRITPDPTSGRSHPVSQSSAFHVDGITGATAVIYSLENAVLTSAANEDVATLAAIDPGVFPQISEMQNSSFVQGTVASNMAALRDSPDGILVNIALADGLKLRIGDPAKVMFARGTDQQTRATATVVGLFQRFPGAPTGTDIVASIPRYEQVSGRAQADYYLAAAADRTAAGLTNIVDALSAQKGFDRSYVVQTSASALDKDQSSLTGLSALGLLHLDSFFTFLMAATATGMFVFGLLLQRRREYVTLRALGLRSRDVRRLVLSEAAIASVVGAAIGLLVGVAMASQFVHVLRPIFTLPPVLAIPAPRLALFLLLVLSATVLSSAAAAVLIGRMRPTELLRDE